jgi:hypothetical protein
LAEEFSLLPRGGVRANTLVQVLGHCASFSLGSGDRAKAEAIWREIRDLAERTNDPTTGLRAIVTEITVDTLDGNLEAAVEAAERAVAGGEQSQSIALGESSAVQGFRARLYLGKAAEALQSIESGGGSQHREALPLAHLGRRSEALVVVRRLVDKLESLRMEASGLAEASIVLEAAVLCEDPSAAAAIALVLEPLASIVSTRARDLTCIARHLGAASALLGKPAEACSYYHQAIEVCTRVRFRPELALTRLQLAELVLEHYPDERHAAIEHLDFAIAEFRDMKMQPSLERALRHRELLKA